MGENTYRVVMQVDTPTQIVWLSKPTPQERDEFFDAWKGWTFDISKPLDKSKTTFALTQNLTNSSKASKAAVSQTPTPKEPQVSAAEKLEKPMKKTTAAKKVAKKTAAKKVAKKTAAKKPGTKVKVDGGSPAFGLVVSKYNPKPRRSASYLFRELIMQGRFTDEVILSKVREKFPDITNSLQYVAWHRWSLRKQGHKAPDRKFA